MYIYILYKDIYKDIYNIYIYIYIYIYILISLKSAAKFHVMSQRNRCSHTAATRSFVSQNEAFQMQNS